MAAIQPIAVQPSINLCGIPRPHSHIIKQETKIWTKRKSRTHEELQQLHKREAMVPKKKNELTYEYKLKALR